MSDGPNLSEVMRGRAGASGAVFTAETFGSLHPDGGAIFCCSDAREEAGNKLLNLQGKQAFPFPVPGTAWPPFDKVDRLRKAMLALALEKGASEFRMAVHSDCGAAELGLRYPEPHLAPNARIAAIVDDTAQTVDNLPQVSKMMLTT